MDPIINKKKRRNDSTKKNINPTNDNEADGGKTSIYNALASEKQAKRIKWYSNGESNTKFNDSLIVKLEREMVF